ncbi:MAG: type IV pilin protein [Legionellaceae bacterium]|nr:type IV pilin protein [Legionellaceae bacterium]
MQSPIQPRQGFTLLELMIVILIISIMATYSYPSYKLHIIKLRRIDGKTALFDLANRLENYYTLNNSYAKATIGTGSKNDVLASPYSEDRWYILSIVSQSQSTFTIQAIPQKNQALDDVECRSYSLNNQGAKLANNSHIESSKCW